MLAAGDRLVVQAMSKEQAKQRKTSKLKGKLADDKTPSFRSRPQLQLLNGVDGIFAPGVLTALMGATGAGKTTLMDVLAGRKTGESPFRMITATVIASRVVGSCLSRVEFRKATWFVAAGVITGEIKVNGFKQDLRTFKRVSGYCEQFDIHSPQSTVGEALWFSARLRLAPDVTTSTMKMFMQEVRGRWRSSCWPLYLAVHGQL